MAPKPIVESGFDESEEDLQLQRKEYRKGNMLRCLWHSLRIYLYLLPFFEFMIQPMEESGTTDTQPEIPTEESVDCSTCDYCPHFFIYRECPHSPRCLIQDPENYGPGCALNSVGLPLRPGGEYCKTYRMWGLCIRGAGCIYDHSPTDDSSAPGPSFCRSLIDESLAWDSLYGHSLTDDSSASDLSASVASSIAVHSLGELADENQTDSDSPTGDCDQFIEEVD